MQGNDPRAQALEAWAKSWLASQSRFPAATGHLEPVSGDASFRRYFRLPIAGGSLIGVDAPPAKENSRPFVAIARAFRAHGLHVPEVLAVDFAQGFMVLEDLGNTLLLGALNETTVDDLYGQAMRELLPLMDCVEVPDYPLPPYDRQRLMDEMHLFRDWFCGSHLGLTLSEDEQAVLQGACDAIADQVLSQPQACVHRDYHSRNLMLLADGELGIIDFQDALVGAITYDLLSLLRDAYVVWPLASVQHWVRQFAALLRDAGRIDVDDATFQRWFDWMGAQRHLKVVGIFARLYHRDGKAGYLNDIPRTFNYLLQEIKGYPEFAALDGLLRERILPVYLMQTPEARQHLTAF